MKIIPRLRCIVLFTSVISLLLTSCSIGGNNQKDLSSSTDNIAATGYSSGEIQIPQIKYLDTVFYYGATGFNEPLPDGFVCVGTIQAVDNLCTPQANLCGARVEIGQSVFADSSVPDVIYLQYKSGYARFSAGS